ncbi:MAG: site-specific DNA-methyltransferase [Dysgonamonadaceae bacterium]|nr:site-specific DNA-methyltransferase [Dysgonamonadaceae bacterium]
MNNERSNRNKTITLSKQEEAELSHRLLTLSAPVSLDDIINRTICGDINKTLAYLPKAFADLVIIDPPYNLSRDFAGMKFKEMTHERYMDYLRSWFPAVVSLLKPKGSLYLCGDWKCSAALYTVMSEHLTIVNRITWQREKGRGAKANWKNSMEDIWFGVKSADHYYFNIEAVKMKRKVIAPYQVDGKPKDWEKTAEGNFRLTHPSNFWDDITVPYWSMAENTEHPTQKPEKLIAKLILASCPENGTVFDPFLGSGTTSVVAKKLGRQYCGIELSREYACLAEKRLQTAETNKVIQGYEHGIFWERNTLWSLKRN